MKNLLSYKYTLVTIMFGVIFYIVAISTDIEVMKNIMRFLEQFKNYSLDELLIVGFIASLGLIIDIMRNKTEKGYKLQLHLEKLQILKSTLRTMQDVINNLVVALQYFKVNAEEHGYLDEESREVIDTLIKTTTEKIDTLSNLEDANVKEMYSGLSVIDYEKEKSTDKG